MNTIKINCVLNTTNPSVPLGAEIWVDNNRVFDTDHLEGLYKFEHQLVEDDAEHELRFVLKNKQEEHTIVNESGNIISDACLTITDISFDEIMLGQIVVDKAIYTHNFNGAGEKIQTKFYSDIGCNGEVSLKFNTPIYLWLLENM